MLVCSAVSATFPLLPAQLRQAEDPPDSVLPTSPAIRRVAIIDDDIGHADSLVQLCSSAGYEATASYSGESGLERLRSQPADVLILDLNMPGMDGIGVLQALQSLELSVKTIVLTGTQDFALVSKIVRLGAYDFLTKPTQPAQLLGALRRAVSLLDLEAENERNRQAVERANALRSFLVDATVDFVYVLDSEGHFTYLNNKLSDLFNPDNKELLGASWRDLFEGFDISEELARRISEQRTGQRSTREFQFDLEPADGQPRTLLCTSVGLYARPEQPSSGSYLGTYGVIRDITALRQAELDRLKMESALQQMGKMEAIGQLAGGIAHDFNNILAGMLGYAGLIQTAHQRLTPESMDEYVGEIVDAGHRARDLIAQLQTFTRTNRSAAGPVDLVDTVVGVSRMLRAAIPSTIGFLQDFQEDLPPAYADALQIQQIALNLLVNARDAIDGKGVIELRVHRNTGAMRCTLCDKTLTEPHLVLSVADTGHGVPPELTKKIFEMHFSTRSADQSNLGNVPGSGSGIGLWLINSLVHDYGGHISLESTLGQGSTFRIHLPIAESDLARASETPAAELVDGEIIVVDDIVSVATFIGELLRDRGFDPVVFSDSQAALTHLEDRNRNIGMLITDQSMPGITGLDLIEAARAIRPELATILITAYASDTDRQRMAALEVDALLPKTVPRRRAAGYDAQARPPSDERHQASLNRCVFRSNPVGSAKF